MVFLRNRGIDAVGFVETLYRFIRCNLRDVQAIELAQLIGSFHRGTGHAAQLRITTHQFLDGQCVQDAPALGDFQAFFFFYCRLQAIRPALQIRDAAFRRIN